MQSHHLQGAHYPCLLKLQFVKIADYGASVYDNRGAEKSLAQPGQKQAIATEDFDVHTSYFLS